MNDTQLNQRGQNAPSYDKIDICMSKAMRADFGIVGHVGVGHVHSHSGFVQDDSAGFTVVGSLLQRVLGVDTRIAEVQADVKSGTITVKTAGGGVGSAAPRRGLTPAEGKLLASGAGLDALFSQTCAVNVFGRLYGQGAAETAVCFQGACALAVLDSFVKAAPDSFRVMSDKVHGCYDTAAAAVMDIDGDPVSLMLVINFTEGGIGPDEDYEGNTMWGSKGQLMGQVGLDTAKTVVVESKAFIPGLSDELETPHILIRAQKDVDDAALATAFVTTARDYGIPYRFLDNVMPLERGSMAKATGEFADRVIAVAERLKKADRAYDKVRITAELATLVSEDAGGVTFMGNSINDLARGAGLMPHTGVVVSMIAPLAEKEHWKIPLLTKKDLQVYSTVILCGMRKLCGH